MRRSPCGTVEGAVVWCNLDPCGLLCAAITWALLVYAQITATAYIIAPWMSGSILGQLHSFLFNFVALMAYMAHFRAMTTDPGAVSARAEAPVDLEDGAAATGVAAPRRFCRRCNAYKPVRAHHCSICQRCVVKMDHHCPWVNNCVGIGNHKFFLQFISYVCLMSMYAMGLVVGRFMSCVGDADGCGDPAGNLLVVFLLLESLLFGMFTLCMVFDQWTVVSTNQTQIDRLKGEVHASQTEINEVFGGSGRRCRLDWLLPTRVEFPAEVWEDIMGYRCKAESEVEMNKYYVPNGGDMGSAPSDAGSGHGKVRERKGAGDKDKLGDKSAAETQRLLADGGGGVLGLSTASSAGGAAGGGTGGSLAPNPLRFEMM